MSGRIIYLIDDDEEDIQFMKDVVHLLDPTIVSVSFTNPALAIKSLTELIIPPDYIFIDINMPKITGGVCLVQLRANPTFIATPIILYSTSMPQEVSQNLLKSGADFTFAKPNTEEGYLLILKNILSRN